MSEENSGELPEGTRTITAAAGGALLGAALGGARGLLLVGLLELF